MYVSYLNLNISGRIGRIVTNRIPSRTLEFGDLPRGVAITSLASNDSCSSRKKRKKRKSRVKQAKRISFFGRGCSTLYVAVVKRETKAALSLERSLTYVYCIR